LVVVAALHRARIRSELQALELSEEGIFVHRRGALELWRRWPEVEVARLLLGGEVELSARRTGHRLKVPREIAREPEFLALVLTYASQAGRSDADAALRSGARSLRPQDVTSVELGRSRRWWWLNEMRVRAVATDGSVTSVDVDGPLAFRFAVAAQCAGADVRYRL
jgi:hypothetical protein